MIVSHNKLRVDKNVAAEDQRRNTSVYQLRGTIVWEKCGHESEYDKGPKSSKQVRHPGCEVILRLTCKESQGDKYTSGEDQGLQHYSCVVERNYNGDGIRFQRGKAAEEKKICRIRFAFPECQEHETDSSKERDPHHPWVGLDPVLVTSAEI